MTSKYMMEDRPKDAMGRVGPSKPKGVCFNAPEGSELEGQSGEAHVDWKRLPNGQIELTAINGAALAGYGAGREPRQPPEDDMA